MQLHITNGDAVLYLFRKGGLPGTQLAWRDALHEGPVFADCSLEELSVARARYLGDAGYGNPIKLNYDFEKRDAVMKTASMFDEIVLWFEHDLYDQLQLLQLLDYFAREDTMPGWVQLVQSDSYLGMLEPTELLAFLPKRRPISSDTFSFAQRAWKAFAAPSPLEFNGLRAEVPSGLPFVRAAIERLCEEFPSAENGLSRTQMQILDSAARGVGRKEELFRVSQSREEAAYLGDTVFYKYVDELVNSPSALLMETAGSYAPTLLGSRVLNGDADWLETRPIDRWIGGVHLTAKTQWRWDAHAKTLIERTHR
ncbi:MAG: hypothetical protein ABI182_06165 [Candidatus Baltobacteraceae bacterium]